MDVVDSYLAASRLQGFADRLRARVQVAAALAESMPWHSLAGTAFRDHARATCADVLGAAAALDRLADDIRARALALGAGP